MKGYDGYREDTAQSPEAKRLIEALAAAHEVTLRREKLARELEELEKEERRFTQDVIPTLLDALGVTGKATFGRFQVVAKEDLKGALPGPVDKRSAAIGWLDAHDHGDVVSRQLQAEFGRESTALMLAVRTAILQVAPGTNVVDKFDVPHQTLKKLARELRAEGRECPLEVLGLHLFREAKVSLL